LSLHAALPISDAGIAGGALHDRRPRPQGAAAFGIQQQAKRGAVLDRTAGIEELGLAEDLAAGQLRGAAQADQRGAADRGGQVWMDAHGGVLGIGPRNLTAAMCRRRPWPDRRGGNPDNARAYPSHAPPNESRLLERQLPQRAHAAPGTVAARLQPG